MPERRRYGRVVALAVLIAVSVQLPTAVAQSAGGALNARRLAQNPLITVSSSLTLGDNVNGPTVVRVPEWVDRPLGKYYMYFANHMGTFVRLAYAPAVSGPWKVHEPGVLDVHDTAFFREQPDPVETREDFYTHVASPEILFDAAARRIVIWTHGWWTRGERWPVKPADARTWARANGYGQYTQSAVSNDGLHFTVQPAVTKTSYLRVFARGSSYFGVSRLGLVSRASNPLDEFVPGPNVFRGTAFAGRVRHVALVVRNNRLLVFFTAIGDAPERVYMSSVDLVADWQAWHASAFTEVLAPETAYECVDLPNVPSEGGDISAPAKQIRDPFVFEDEGRAFLFYSTCGEQGIAAAEITLP